MKTTEPAGRAGSILPVRTTNDLIPASKFVLEGTTMKTERKRKRNTTDCNNILKILINIFIFLEKENNILFQILNRCLFAAAG